MTLMSDIDIKQALNSDIVIEPYSEDGLTPIGYDFCVGEFIYSLEYGLLECKEDIYELPPKSTVQILTKESLWVSKRIGGTFHSKVSLVSKGLSHISTTLDPEWYGPLLITLRNNTDKPIKLGKDDTFVTLLFYRLITPTDSFHWRSWRDIIEEHLKDKTEKYISRVRLNLNNDQVSEDFATKVQQAHLLMQQKKTELPENIVAEQDKVDQRSKLESVNVETTPDRSSTTTTLTVKIKRIHNDAQIPYYSYPDDSGADVYATEDCILQPLERKAISTGLMAEVPTGFELQVRPRSGLALKNAVTVLNTPGTIDAGYRGEIKVILINLGSEPYEVKKGQKIAQLVVAAVCHAQWKEVEDLTSSDRGAGGFGSTGVS